MTTQHTDGPWQLTIGENDAAIHTNVTIARISDEAHAWQANARLISAAPDLLAALRLLLSSAMPPEGSLEWKIENGKRMHAQAAIAKAEGIA